MATYYIAPTGSDTTGNGTISSPWRTINKFVSITPAPGDLLYCRGGVYADSGVVNFYALSGTAEAPITIRNYPGEVPHFQGPATYGADFLHFDRASSYIVVDGLTISEINCSNTIIWIGHTDSGTGEAGATRTHHITVRNCTITKDPSGDALNYAFYLSWMGDDITIEDCHIIGYAAHNASANAAIHVYHPPAPRNILIQRNIIEDWHDGIMVADISPATCTGDILHNSFLGCETNINLWRHAADFVVRDNAGEDGSAANLVDSNTPYATADHNFWAQTFDANYYLDSGDTGWKAASDGLDAGALNYNPSAPGPAIGLTHAFVSARGDGADMTKLQPSHWNAEHVIGSVRILSGTGTPEGTVAAPVGSLFLRTDGSTSTTLYVKTSGTGNTGWTAK